MSNSVPECEKDNLTGCVSFYTQWIDICVCIRVRGLHLVLCWIWAGWIFHANGLCFMLMVFLMLRVSIFMLRVFIFMLTNVIVAGLYWRM